MTSADDYRSEMTDHMSMAAHDGDPDDLAVELMLTGDGGASGDLMALLDDMRLLAAGPAPTPTAGLAALLSQGLPGLAQARRRSRRRKIVAGVVLGGVASLGLTGVAAANDRLPGGAQDVVSRVVNGLTPFHVDAKHSPADPAPAPHRSRPTEISTAPRSASVPTPGSSGSTGSDDHGGGGSGGSGPGQDDTSPSPRPSESSGGDDDHGGSTTGSNREPSDPPISAQPTRTTGDGVDDSGGSRTGGGSGGDNGSG